jgi:iron complex outermembrane receptor protein
MKTTRKTLCLLLVLASGGACAEDDVAAAAQYFGEFPVVLSASRLIQPVDEAPAAVTVIDRDTIRASGARQIAELFRLVPGFLVTYRNGHSPAVTYHGLADTYARRLQVMVDGVSVYSPLFGGVDWNDLPLAVEDIDRIEIIRGPNGASFGANAFVGMVNIITREPAAGRQSEVAGIAGTNGVADWNLRHFGGADALRYRLSAGERVDEGFDGRIDSSRVRYANFRGHYQVDSANEIMGTLSHTSGAGDEQYEATRVRRFESADLQLRWTVAKAADEFWLQFHHTQRTNHEAYTANDTVDFRSVGGGVLPIQAYVNFGYDLRRDEVEFQKTYGGLDNWRLVLGGQWREDGVRSQGLFSRSDWLRSDMERLFGSVEWKPARSLLVHGGATYERNSLSGNSLSPRLSATAFLSPDHAFRIGISQARRTPTLYEEFTNQSYPVPANLHALLVSLAPRLPAPWSTTLLSPILVQPYRASGGLVDERILSREIAYLGKLPALRLSGEVRWFWDHARDLIYLHRVPFPTALDPAAKTGDIRNQDQADIRGVEGSLRWAPWSGATLTAAAARTVIESSNVDVNYSVTAPVHSVSALFRQELPGDMSASVAYYRVGPMTWLSGGDPLPAADRVDLRLGKRFNWGRQHLDVDLVVQNATNEKSPEFDNLRYSERVTWLRFQYAF